MDWLDLLSSPTPSSKPSILQPSAFFIVQLSHQYMTTGKTIALTRRTFIGKVMSLLFNMLSRLVIIFLPRSKRLLISWDWVLSDQFLEFWDQSDVTLLMSTTCVPWSKYFFCPIKWVTLKILWGFLLRPSRVLGFQLRERERAPWERTQHTPNITSN